MSDTDYADAAIGTGFSIFILSIIMGILHGMINAGLVSEDIMIFTLLKSILIGLIIGFIAFWGSVFVGLLLIGIKSKKETQKKTKKHHMHERGNNNVSNN